MHSGQLGCVFNWTFSYTVMFFFARKLSQKWSRLEQVSLRLMSLNVLTDRRRQRMYIFATRCYASAAYAVVWCVCVCMCVCVSVKFVHSVKTTKHIFKCFSPSGSHTILVFPYQTAWQYSDGKPTNGGVECRWGRQKSRFWANNGSSGKCNTLSCDRPRRVYNTSRW